MNEFKNAKEAYENTPIPAGLSERVQAGSEEGKAPDPAPRGRAVPRGAPAAPGPGGCWGVCGPPRAARPPPASTAPARSTR